LLNSKDLSPTVKPAGVLSHFLQQVVANCQIRDCAPKIAAGFFPAAGPAFALCKAALSVF
jgi:hypothetical protein